MKYSIFWQYRKVTQYLYWPRGWLNFINPGWHKCIHPGGDVSAAHLVRTHRKGDANFVQDRDPIIKCSRGGQGCSVSECEGNESLGEGRCAYMYVCVVYLHIYWKKMLCADPHTYVLYLFVYIKSIRYTYPHIYFERPRYRRVNRMCSIHDSVGLRPVLEVFMHTEYVARSHGYSQPSWTLVTPLCAVATPSVISYPPCINHPFCIHGPPFISFTPLYHSSLYIIHPFISFTPLTVCWCRRACGWAAPALRRTESTRPKRPRGGQRVSTPSRWRGTRHLSRCTEWINFKNQA